MNKKVYVIRKQSETTSFGEIKIDGKFTKYVKNKILKDNKTMTNNAVETIFTNAFKILNNCPNPKPDLKIEKNTGIIIGKIQSGKTSNFISLLAMAFDNGYNLAVVLGGITKELFDQNIKRITGIFSKLENQQIKIINTSSHGSIINPKQILGWLNDGTKIIIVSLKSPQIQNKKHMTKISELFDDEIMRKQPVIIIDDEGDQATLNSKKYSNKKSATYKVAVDIMNKINKYCFLTVTATPQANILIDPGTKLSPIFVYLVYPGEGYCGLSVFHGKEQDKFVKTIPDNEISLLDETNKIPESFYLAFASFFVSNAIRKARGDNNKHSMLIHPSEKKFYHTKIKDKIDKVLEQWKKDVKNIDDIAYNNFLKRAQTAYKKYINNGVSTVSFEELEEEIIQSVKNCSTIVINSDQKDDVFETVALLDTVVLIGGNIMGRGLTVDGLAITYIIRRAKKISNVDTTEQRARWFGYKNIPGHSDYIDICRVWATKKIKDDFANIYESDKNMWLSIEKNKTNKLENENRVFILRGDLRPTRATVQKTKTVNYEDWKHQKYYVSNNEKIAENTKLIDEFLKNKSFYAMDFDNRNRHKIYKHIKTKDFYNNLLKKIHFHEKEDLKRHLFFLFENITAEILNIILIRPDFKQERTVKEDGMIEVLFRGRDITENSFGNYTYKGDDSLKDGEPDIIHVQIHYVSPKGWKQKKYSPFIAIYIPEEHAIKLVEREEND